MKIKSIIKFQAVKYQLLNSNMMNQAKVILKAKIIVKE